MGRRNVAYLACTALVDAALLVIIFLDPPGLDGVTALAETCIVWLCASGVFFAVNALLVLGWAVDRLKGGAPIIAAPVSHAVIGCALPTAVVLVGMAFIA